MAIGGPDRAEAAKNLEFGDAPDGRQAYPASPGRYPSRLKNNAIRFKSDRLKLGLNSERERDSEQVNLDTGEDGITLEHVPCQEVTYRFKVNAGDLPKRERRGKAFLNLFVDWNLDGRWRGIDDRCGPGAVPEHRVVNERVKLQQFRKKPIRVVSVRRAAGGTALAVDDPKPPFWYRAVVSKKKLRTPSEGGTGRQALGEVEDFGPGMGNFPEKDKPGNKRVAEFGDAHDNLFGGPRLCLNGLSFCEYPSLLPFGPVHLKAGPLRMGGKVDTEPDAQNGDLDAFGDDNDDGFRVSSSSDVDNDTVRDPVSPADSCKRLQITWNLNVKQLKKSGKNRDRRLLRRIRKRKIGVFVDAFIDYNNNGLWAGASDCQGGIRDEHVVDGFELFGRKLKQLVKTGKTKLTLRAKGAAIADEGLGCVRGIVALGQSFRDVMVRSPFNVGEVAAPFVYGETTDHCAGDGGPTPPPDPPPPDPPPDPPPPGAPDCSNTADDDGDTLVDAADFGCLTGPGGAYDPDDASEADALAPPATCPANAAETHVRTHTYVDNDTLIRHVLELGGTLVVDKGQADGDFADGSLAPFNVTCTGGTTASASVEWTTTPGGGGSPPPILEYKTTLTYVSGTGGTISMHSAPNTRE